MAGIHLGSFCRGADGRCSIGLIKRKFAQPFVQSRQLTVVGHVDAGHAVADRIRTIFHFREKRPFTQPYRCSTNGKFIVEQIIPSQPHEGPLLHAKSCIVLKLSVDGQSRVFDGAVDDPQGTRHVVNGIVNIFLQGLSSCCYSNRSWGDVERVQ